MNSFLTFKTHFVQSIPLLSGLGPGATAAVASSNKVRLGDFVWLFTLVQSEGKVALSLYPTKDSHPTSVNLSRDKGLVIHDKVCL